MCNLSKGVREEGRIEGRTEGRIEGKIEGTEVTLAASIESLMKKLKLTAEQAMDALSIPEDEQAKYKKMVKL